MGARGNTTGKNRERFREGVIRGGAMCVWGGALRRGPRGGDGGEQIRGGWVGQENRGETRDSGGGEGARAGVRGLVRE